MLGLQKQLEVLRNSDAVLIKTVSGKVLYEGYAGNTEYSDRLKNQEVKEVHIHFNPQRKGTKEKLKMQDVEIISCADVEFKTGITIIVKE